MIQQSGRRKNSCIDMSEVPSATILIVEDEPGVAYLQRRTLERSGFRVRSVSSSEEALESLRQPGVDLIIVDFYLSSDVTGLDFFHHLKSIGHDLPVILVTGRSAEALVIEALRAGVRDFVVKTPEYLEYLPHAVQRVLKQVQLERRLSQSEEQIRQMQKLDSIGQFAAGIAHDFNNIVTVQRGFAELLLQDPDLPDSLRDHVLQISEASRRAGNLTRQLLLFSRKQALQPRKVDLNSIVRDVNRLLTRILDEHIGLKLNYADQLCPLWADPGMLEQVLVNLASNARDAMKPGGELRISTFEREVSESHAQSNPEARPGRFVCLEVEDNGSGMAPEVVSHIFEPLFTTKEAEKGTGLGLATVLGIVKQHQGWIEVETELNKGTTFRIFLPGMSDPSAFGPGSIAATERPAVEISPSLSPSRKGEAARFRESTPPDGEYRRNEGNRPSPELKSPAELSESRMNPDSRTGRAERATILVVEDEEAVRKMIVDVLKHRGYDVLAAATGADALDSWPEQGEKVDLLITDMVMPGGITGHDLAEQLWRQKPLLKVIYTSGYTAESTGLESLLADRARFLQKPYTPRQLLQTVQQFLGQPAASRGSVP